MIGGEAVLDKRNWFVKTIDEHAIVLDFLERWHYAKGGPRTSVVRDGLYRYGSDKLWGVTLWLPPTKNAAKTVSDDWRNVLCLSRLAVHSAVPKNGASFLLGASMRGIDPRWHSFLTYADQGHGHTGAIYRATNWTCVGETKGGRIWVDSKGRQVGQKRGAVNLTREQMIALGCTQLPPSRKWKFVFHR